MLIASAFAPRATSSWVATVVGALFVVAGFANLLVLETSANVLNFEPSNVIFALVSGLALLVLGLYGRGSRALDEDNPYRLQAELALTHLAAPSAAETDWRRMVRLYDRLLDLHRSPVIALNRAVAVGMAESPARGLEALDAISGLDQLALLHAARADLLERAGRTAEAVVDLDRALELVSDEAESRQLSRRRSELAARAFPR